MGNLFDILMTVVFAAIGGFMFYRAFRTHKKIMFYDKTWGGFRSFFALIATIALLSMVYGNNDFWGQTRNIVLLFASMSFLFVRDGIGEEGIVTSGQFLPWSEVRAYDYVLEEKKLTAFFTVESQNKKKPDQYSTQAIDFDRKNEKQIIEFLNLNIGRKRTRMKKK